MPLDYPPGALADVDFFEVYADVHGETSAEMFDLAQHAFRAAAVVTVAAAPRSPGGEGALFFGPQRVGGIEVLARNPRDYDALLWSLREPRIPPADQRERRWELRRGSAAERARRRAGAAAVGTARSRPEAESAQL